MIKVRNDAVICYSPQQICSLHRNSTTNPEFFTLVVSTSGFWYSKTKALSGASPPFFFLQEVLGQWPKLIVKNLEKIRRRKEMCIDWFATQFWACLCRFLSHLLSHLNPENHVIIHFFSKAKQAIWGHPNRKRQASIWLPLRQFQRPCSAFLGPWVNDRVSTTCLISWPTVWSGVN